MCHTDSFAFFKSLFKILLEQKFFVLQLTKASKDSLINLTVQVKIGLKNGGKKCHKRGTKSAKKCHILSKWPIKTFFPFFLSEVHRYDVHSLLPIHTFPFRHLPIDKSSPRTKFLQKSQFPLQNRQRKRLCI